MILLAYKPQMLFTNAYLNQHNCVDLYYQHQILLKLHQTTCITLNYCLLTAHSDNEINIDNNTISKLTIKAHL